MGNRNGKKDGIVYTEATFQKPRRGTCARIMFDKYGPDAVRDVGEWCNWTKNSRLPFPENVTFYHDCLDNLRKVLEVKNRDKKAQKHVNWSVYINWMKECRDRVEKARLLNLKGQLDQLTKQMPVRLENITKRQRAVAVRFEDEEEDSDTWPEGIVPIAQPLEDEEVGETEGDDATGQGEARRGARGVIKKEAETRPREKVPLAISTVGL